jgi:hypothetical protein
MKEDIMFRHPRYVDIPWEVHWNQTEAGPRHHLWLMVILILMAMFLIGVGVTSGLT